MILLPNTPIPDEKIDEIHRLSGRYNKGYIAQRLGIHVDTVTKYIREFEGEEK